MKLIQSILKHRCPQCREGRLFTHSAYHLKKTMKMYEKCSQCGQSFHLEPSFYYGALYVSYGLQVAIFATVSGAIAILYPGAPTAWYLIGVTVAILVLFPLVIRFSRSIWIHIFVKYDEKKANAAADS
ncbi:MAG: DUF983 domain-containing protein [Ekhidna sp.]|nr:DUF983 domain-containing protein [Ekhidna sp.]